MRRRNPQHSIREWPDRESEGLIVCAWQRLSQAGWSPARLVTPSRYPKAGVMPRWPRASLALGGQGAHREVGSGGFAENHRVVIKESNLKDQPVGQS